MFKVHALRCIVHCAYASFLMHVDQHEVKHNNNNFNLYSTKKITLKDSEGCDDGFHSFTQSSQRAARFTSTLKYTPANLKDA